MKTWALVTRSHWDGNSISSMSISQYIDIKVYRYIDNLKNAIVYTWDGYIKVVD